MYRICLQILRAVPRDRGACEAGSSGIVGSKCQSAKFNLNHPAYRTHSPGIQQFNQ
jgi:hypothetical protein